MQTIKKFIEHWVHITVRIFLFGVLILFLGRVIGDIYLSIALADMNIILQLILSCGFTAMWLSLLWIVILSQLEKQDEKRKKEREITIINKNGG